LSKIVTFKICDWQNEAADLVDGADDLLIAADDAGSKTNAVVVLSEIRSLVCKNKVNVPFYF
jgi:hypothetical protein